MPAPKLVEEVSLLIKGLALDKHMLNVARDVLARAEETKSLFIGLRPMATEPVTPITTTKQFGNHQSLVNFKGVARAGSP